MKKTMKWTWIGLLVLPVSSWAYCPPGNLTVQQACERAEQAQQEAKRQQQEQMQRQQQASPSANNRSPSTNGTTTYTPHTYTPGSNQSRQSATSSSGDVRTENGVTTYTPRAHNAGTSTTSSIEPYQISQQRPSTSNEGVTNANGVTTFTPKTQQETQRQQQAQIQSNLSRQENSENSNVSNLHYQVPHGRCLALKVEGDSIMVVNHCGVPIIGQFCFIHSQLYSCADSTAGSFGPVGVGDKVLIATTADTNPRSNELKYVLCNADAADQNQCQTYHP